MLIIMVYMVYAIGLCKISEFAAGYSTCRLQDTTVKPAGIL